MGSGTFVSKRQKGFLWYTKRSIYLKFVSRSSTVLLSALPWYKTRNIGLKNAPGAAHAGRFSAGDRKVFDRIVGLYNTGKVSQRKFAAARTIFLTRARQRARGVKVSKRLPSIELFRKAGRKKIKR